MDRGQLLRFAEALYQAHSEARIESGKDYDPTEDTYYLAFQLQDAATKRLWVRVAEKLSGAVQETPAGA